MSLSVSNPQRFFDEFQRALGRRDPVVVARLIGEAITDKLPLGMRWLMLAKVASHDGRPDLVRACLETALSQDPHNQRLGFEVAANLAELGDAAGAISLLGHIPSTFPDIATHAHLAGTLEMQLGHAVAAGEQFERALAARPTSGITWLSYVATKRGIGEEVWCDRVLEAIRPMAAVPESERAPFQFALGDTFHAMKNYDSAFDAYRTGADIMRRLRVYNFGEDRAATQMALWPSLANHGNLSTSARPIFVIGLPRSGTTLLQQIFSAHPDVTGGGELGAVDKVVRMIGGITVDDYERSRKSGFANKLAQMYLNDLRYRFGEEGRVVDKSINLSRFVGIIASVFPNAPMIWIRRQPLDCAWSCFRTFFSSGMPWSWSLDDIAAHFKLEDQLFRQWQGLLGDRLMTIDLEALVAHPQESIAALLDHCGLAQHQGPFSHHSAASVITTASVLQVRRPINSEGIGAAENYRRHLGPFLTAYNG